MNTIPCDLVLLPHSDLANKAIEASNTLSKFGSIFTLKIGEYYPHMSLYMFQLDVADIAKVEAIMQEVADSTPVVQAKATKYSLGQGFGVGYVDPEYRVTDELAAIQNRIVAALNPVRAGMRESDINKMQDATGLKLENLQKYGYPTIGELFRPHVTLTRLDSHKPEVLDVLPDIQEFSGVFDRIGLFEMGANGTCIRQIVEVPFKG